MVEERGVKRVSMEDKEREKASKVAFFFFYVAEAHLSIIKKRREEQLLDCERKFLGFHGCKLKAHRNVTDL